jgi:hypothetical protein
LLKQIKDLDRSRGQILSIEDWNLKRKLKDISNEKNELRDIDVEMFKLHDVCVFGGFESMYDISIIFLQ